jgi:RHS repeat-associated protein
VRAVTATGAAPGTDTFSYDAAGNTTARRLQGRPEQVLSWDAEGRLTQLVEGSGTTRYLYDADGARLLALEPGGATLYLDGQEVRRTASGVTATRYYGDVASRTPTGLTWLAANHQGTSQVAVGAGDLSVTRRRLDPFGNPRGTQPAWPTTRGFVGGVSDPSGLTHLGAREYDPRTGRFVSHDPVFAADDPQQSDGYAYAGHSPVTFADPAGTCRGREEGDLCPGHTRGPWAPTPEGDRARERHFNKTPPAPCKNNGSRINCPLTPAQEAMRRKLEKMRADFEKNCRGYTPLDTSCNVLRLGSDTNPYEQAWCYAMGVDKCLLAFSAFREADRTNPFKKDTPEWGAFKHGYWFALIGWSGGVSAEEAALLGGAHEMGAWIKRMKKGEGNPNVDFGGPDSNNDMYNNALGFQIGRDVAASWKPGDSPTTRADVATAVAARVMRAGACPESVASCLIPTK